MSQHAQAMATQIVCAIIEKGLIAPERNARGHTTADFALEVANAYRTVYAAVRKPLEGGQEG